MKTRATDPTIEEMEVLVGRAGRCLTCTARFGPDGSTCYEFTPGGVEVCADLPWWNGQPIMPETLRNWKEIVASGQAVPHRSDD